MSGKKPKVKITILQRTYRADLVEKYMTGDNHICDQFKDGQEFVTDQPWSVPQGFCTWAWADIRGDIQTVILGGDLPWMRERHVAISMCSDVFRPVIFKIERIE